MKIEQLIKYTYLNRAQCNVSYDLIKALNKSYNLSDQVIQNKIKYELSNVLSNDIINKYSYAFKNEHKNNDIQYELDLIILLPTELKDIIRLIIQNMPIEEIISIKNEKLL